MKPHERQMAGTCTWLVRDGERFILAPEFGTTTSKRSEAFVWLDYERAHAYAKRRGFGVAERAVP